VGNCRDQWGKHSPQRTRLTAQFPARDHGPESVSSNLLRTLPQAEQESHTSNSSHLALPTPLAVATVLLYSGTGTSSSDVLAIEARLNAVKLTYATAYTLQLEGMTETQLKTYKFFDHSR
jgi:hypothetical protein